MVRDSNNMDDVKLLTEACRSMKIEYKSPVKWENCSKENSLAKAPG
jgi:hypothetical protein